MRFIKVLIMLSSVALFWSCQKDNGLKGSQSPTSSGDSITNKWKLVYNKNDNFTCLLAIGNSIIAGTDNITYPGGLYISSDSGNTWDTITNGLPDFVRISCLVAIGKDIYAGVPGLYRSSDTGKQWISISGDLSPYTITDIAISGNNILAATSRGVYVSKNDGKHWVQKNSGLSYYFSVYALAIKKDSIYATTDKGVFLSTDTCNTWTPINTGFPKNTMISSLVIKGNKFIAGAASGRIYTSNDNGLHWSNNGTKLNANVRSLIINGDSIYAVTNVYLYYSRDNGVKWDTLSNYGLSRINTYGSIAVSGHYIYAGATYGIWRKRL
ncbi:MAG: hypothetical protein JXR71_10085 [Bacteroidales bacterium]|nr:hypothetical protein [Bacteroidales bacterium]